MSDEEKAASHREGKRERCYTVPAHIRKSHQSRRPRLREAAGSIPTGDGSLTPPPPAEAYGAAGCEAIEVFKETELRASFAKYFAGLARRDKARAGDG